MLSLLHYVVVEILKSSMIYDNAEIRSEIDSSNIFMMRLEWFEFF